MGEQVTYSLSEAVEENTAGNRLVHLDRQAFDAVRAAPMPAAARVALFAQMARLNTLYMIARAGSGHVGSSFSSLDIVSWLHLEGMAEGDRYFSSKGHDSPGLYAVHAGLGIVPFDKIHALRRLNGLPGHPDVGTPGAVTNTGSLGMGVSKAKGFLFADDLRGARGRLFVLTGDGELQEGQFWESLASAARRRDGRLTVIVDHNKIQSDTRVRDVSDLGDLAAKFRAFGWLARECDGHDLDAIAENVGRPADDGRPVAVIAHTVKGRGVSFMEHTAMADDQAYYRYHSGAPSPQEYRRAVDELRADIDARCRAAGVTAPSLHAVDIEPLVLPSRPQRLVPAYSEALLEEAGRDARIVALDADLILDTGLIPFKERFAERFVECGIAEQDMVSQAGTMALAGLVPVVHSFACFLTTRAAEQIYNNCTERTKVVYVGSLAGLLPAGPGHSHQAVRDTVAMSALPDLVVVEPLCVRQVGEAVRWALRSHAHSSYLRLTSIPFEHRDEFDGLEPLAVGRGHRLRDGAHAAIVVTNPVLAVEALRAADRLQAAGHAVTVVGMPWLNRVDADWFASVLPARAPVLVVESHYAEAGFGASFVAAMAEAGLCGERRMRRLGVAGVPASGRNDEVLRHHGLDAQGIAAAVGALVAAAPARGA